MLYYCHHECDHARILTRRWRVDAGLVIGQYARVRLPRLEEVEGTTREHPDDVLLYIPLTALRRPGSHHFAPYATSHKSVTDAHREGAYS